MKVSFEREIDLADVPFEVNKVFKGNLTKLETLLDVLSTLDTTAPEEFIDKLDFVRKKLFDVDSSLDDCSKHMQGYVAIKNGEVDVADTETATPNNLEDVTKSLDDFEDKMKKLMEVSRNPGPSTTAPISMPDPSEFLKNLGNNKNEKS